MTIKQHIPGFCEGFTPETAEFITKEELLAIPFVQRWSEDAGFWGYSISEYKGSLPILMAEFRNRTEWWVIGFIRGYASALGLPKWDPDHPEHGKGRVQ